MNGSAYSEALESLLGTIRKANEAKTISVKAGETLLKGVTVTAEGAKVGQKILKQIALAGSTLERAKPMFWGDEPSDLVFEVANQIDLETRIEPDLLYVESAWCWFARPRVLIPDGPEDEPLTAEEVRQGVSNHPKLWALSWTWGMFTATEEEGADQVEGLVVIGWTKNGPRCEQSPMWTGFIKAGEPLKTCEHEKYVDLPQEKPIALRLLQFAIAAGAFLRTKLARTDQHQPDRHTIKRIAKAGSGAWQGESSLVDVVMLRQREQRDDSTAEGTVEWQHQWIVRAHTRQQWYPARRKHLPIIVMPYLKGPEGKPLKAPTQHIFAVTR